MQDEALQAAFEIKTECDEISRRLLRWHWEQKPGSHSLDALLRHIAQRQKESPDYYDRMPDLSGKTSWQQLDTTLCMRVLLDPEKDAAKPLDLLGNTRHPGAARRACNPVRTAPKPMPPKPVYTPPPAPVIPDIDWDNLSDPEVLSDAYLSGLTIREMSQKSGLSESWLREKLRSMDLIF